MPTWPVAQPQLAPSYAAAHPAHLNRMVHLGVLPPMLRRLSEATTQMLQVGTQEGTPFCLLPLCPSSATHAAGTLRSWLDPSVPGRAHPPILAHHTSLPHSGCRTMSTAARCSSRFCARWATWLRAVGGTRWSSCCARRCGRVFFRSPVSPVPAALRSEAAARTRHCGWGHLACAVEPRGARLYWCRHGRGCVPWWIVRKATTQAYKRCVGGCSCLSGSSSIGAVGKSRAGCPPCTVHS